MISRSDSSPLLTASVAFSKKFGLSPSDGAYTAHTSVSAPTDVVSLNRTVLVVSISSKLVMVTPIFFLANIVTPLSFEKLPKTAYLLIMRFCTFRHFFYPRSIYSTVHNNVDV